MPMHPAAPQGLRDLVEAFAHTTQAVIDLARSCSDDDLALPTECPGWTVHDQISHVVGVEAWLEGHKDPRVEAMPHYEHIKNDLGKRVEYAVEVRRGRTGAEVVTELEHVLAQRLSTLRSPELTDSSIIAGPFGPDQAATVVLMRTFDVWAHEQGRPRGHAMFVGDADYAASWYAPGNGSQTSDQQPDRPTTITLSTEAFTRRAAGRRSVSDTAYSVVGDEAIARRVTEALVVTV